MRVIVAPDKFKGTLTAAEAAAAIALGVRRAAPDAEVVVTPVADGGEGTVDAAVAAGFRRVVVTVSGPAGDPVAAAMAVRGVTAVIEMAEASGLRALSGGRPDAATARTATTFGTGQLIAAALDAGATRVVLGIGGSATTDGGAGMATALGARLADAQGRRLGPGGAALAALATIDVTGFDPRVSGADVTVASDVDNPLVGPHGAAAIYGPQKGAGPAEVAELDAALRRYADVVGAQLGVDPRRAPGAGAAGGLGYGAMVFLGARLEPGIDLLLGLVGFAEALAGADLVFTGEGSLDRQTLHGKAPVGVARAAATAGVPTIALAGQLQVPAPELRDAGFVAAYALTDLEPDLERAKVGAADLLASLATQATADFQRGRPSPE